LGVLVCAYIVRRRLFLFSLGILSRIIIATLVANLYSTAVAVADPYATESVILINTAIISSTESITLRLIKV